MNTYRSLFLSGILLVLSACGGGGDEGAVYEQQVAVTNWEITDEQREALSGEWDIGGVTGSFIVRTQAEFDALWAKRKAYVDCSFLYNRAFCAAAAPPPVDFSKYALVGLLLFSTFQFDDDTPRSVTTDVDHKRLSVSYRYRSIKNARYTVDGFYFLVPRTNAALEVYPTNCSSAC